MFIDHIFIKIIAFDRIIILYANIIADYNIKNFLLKIMGKYIVRLCLLFIILMHVRAQSCIYARKINFRLEIFKIFTNSTALIPYSAAGFNFPVTWNTAQTGFTNYSYYLVGFKMQTAKKVLSFDAKITSISSTNANFYFKFDSHSEIIYGQFGIVLLKPCPGFVRLIHFGRLYIII